MTESLELQPAINACLQGGVIAYPTESVFGLGCLPNNQNAVEKILAFKNRSADKGLICIAAEISQLDSMVDFSAIPNVDSIFSTWPGPVTWLIPALSSTPKWLTGVHDTLAVRVSADPIVRSLCLEVGPLVSTSANPEGMPPAYDSAQVRKYFKEKLDFIIEASLSTDNQPTEIRHGVTGEIIRNSN